MYIVFGINTQCNLTTQKEYYSIHKLATKENYLECFIITLYLRIQYKHRLIIYVNVPILTFASKMYTVSKVPSMIRILTTWSNHSWRFRHNKLLDTFSTEFCRLFQSYEILLAAQGDFYGTAKEDVFSVADIHIVHWFVMCISCWSAVTEKVPKLIL